MPRNCLIAVHQIAGYCLSLKLEMSAPFDERNAIAFFMHGAAFRICYAIL
jgi:hypothetical protein